MPKIWTQLAEKPEGPEMPVLSKKPTGQGAEMGHEVGMNTEGETGMKEMTDRAVPARQEKRDSSLLPPRA